MIHSAERGPRSGRQARDADGIPDYLPYVIELWNQTRTKPMQVIARAQNASLARAIFKAASAENPERKFTLRHNGRTLASTE